MLHRNRRTFWSRSTFKGPSIPDVEKYKKECRRNMVHHQPLLKSLIKELNQINGINFQALLFDEAPNPVYLRVLACEMSYRIKGEQLKRTLIIVRKKDAENTKPVIFAPAHIAQEMATVLNTINCGSGDWYMVAKS